MTLLPTPLEEAAKAMHGAEPWSSFWSTDDARLLATAAITAYLAQAGKEGWVMVPTSELKYITDNSGERTIRDKSRAMLAAAQNGGE